MKMNTTTYDPYVRFQILDYLILEYIRRNGECSIKEIKNYVDGICEITKQSFYAKINRLYKQKHYITQTYYTGFGDSNESVAKIYYVITDIGKDFCRKTSRIIQKLTL